ncbi:MAG: GtrA family protein [Bacilli bacterium]
MKKLIKQLFRFGIVGGTAFLIDYGILFLLAKVIGINELISAAISFVISLAFNYFASIKWVFEAKKQTPKEVIIFVLLSVVGLGINELLIYIGSIKMNIDVMIVKLFATVIVMIYNFITRKLIIEKHN